MPDTVMVSGGFDPLHVGHLDLIEAAAGYGNVIVALNSDWWLEKKKQYLFMPWEERARILSALSRVHTVVQVFDRDRTVCEALLRIRPAYFANGGDRESANPDEHEVCNLRGIKELFGIGGTKTRSSSQIVNDLIKDIVG